MYEVTIPRQLMCLGFDIGSLNFRYSNGYMVVSAREKNIFNQMYNTARENRTLTTDNFAAHNYLSECRNRLLDRLIEDPGVLKAMMPEFYKDKRRYSYTRRKFNEP